MRSKGERAARNAERRAAEKQRWERDRELGERARRGAMTLQRRAWGRGEPGGFAGHVEVWGPDGVPVRIAVGRGGGLARIGKPSELGKSGPVDMIMGCAPLVPVVVAVAVVGGIVMLVVTMVRRLVVELSGKPHWSVSAAVGAESSAAVVVWRSRRAPESARAAAELADRVEREGAAAVLPA
ncbi:hypothetical protein ABTZ03_24315 [Kitasatospora sp. NPDC096077]|uniref:hypothetical protein n=1 Tax=Kitasatospora sp. NPDC096077 TaxID=3155544 RepID=UPI0033253AE9